ncbi:hypothetical protein AB1484_21210 [Parafrankia sp. FMc6]|uniref:hypothetical protein n=1 Tax=Parafrankia soli TaxID=2599596 RepID=UPI0034D46276
MPRPSQRVEQDELRARMRAVGMSHDEIAIEFARRYHYRPRAAHRHARGWTQTQAANHINAHAARVGLDPDGAAPMTGPKLSELENWPLPNNRRRPTPQILALLAEVYDTSIHNLIDLDDREHFGPADLLLIDKTSRTARPQPVELSGQARRQSRTDAGAMVELTAARGTRSLVELCTSPIGRLPEATTGSMRWESVSTTEAVDKITRDDLSLDRREAARAMADVIVGAALLEGAERWLNTIEPPARQRRAAGVGDEEIEQIELAARTFRAWDNQFGGGLRRKAVVGQLAEIADELRDFSHPQSLTRRLHGVMADLAETAATMSWDSGQGGLAQRYYLLALRSAKAADDPVFCANILAGMARQQFYLGRTTEGLELVRLAQDVAGGPQATPAVRAMLFTREAWAYAQQGRLSAFRRATGRAQDAFRDVDPAVEPHWISYFDQAELAGVTGGRLLDIAHQAPEYADEAATWLSQAVRARGGGSVRSTALDQLGHAEIRLVQGEFDEAARLGHAAVTTVEQTRSSRVRVKLGQFYRHAETRTSARPIAELCGRIKPMLRAEDTAAKYET